MADIGTLRDALQTRLDTVSGLLPYDVATGHERMPCSIVLPAPGGGWETAGITDTSPSGVDKQRFYIEVYVSLAGGLARAQDQLDSFISPTGSTSIERAIYADKTLGGSADSTRVFRFDRYQWARLNEPPQNPPNALYARIPVEVLV